MPVPSPAVANNDTDCMPQRTNVARHGRHERQRCQWERLEILLEDEPLHQHHDRGGPPALMRELPATIVRAHYRHWRTEIDGATTAGRQPSVFKRFSRSCTRSSIVHAAGKLAALPYPGRSSMLQARGHRGRAGGLRRLRYRPRARLQVMPPFVHSRCHEAIPVQLLDYVCCRRPRCRRGVEHAVGEDDGRRALSRPSRCGSDRQRRPN